MKTDVHLLQYLSQFLLEKNVSCESYTENQNTHFIFKNCVPKRRVVYEKMWKFWWSMTAHR